MFVTNPEARPDALRKATELGQQLGMSTSSIYRRRSLGESLPTAIRIGKGSLRWRQSDIDAWLDSQMETTND